MRSSLSTVLSGLGALVLALAAAGAGQAVDDPIASAFVVLGEDGAPQARVITTAADCPSMDVDGKALPMTVRAKGRDGRPAPDPVRPQGFQALGLPRHRLRGGPAGGRGPRRRERPSPALAGRPPQADRGDRRHGLPAQAVGRRLPGLQRAQPVPLRQGRRRRRGLEARSGPACGRLPVPGERLQRRQASGLRAASPWGYGWDAWDADFFAPAAPLLAAAPWVAARGNHESCTRAGQGWWRFIDPRALLAGRDCNDAANDSVGDYSDPYAVPLGDGAQIVVMDSSNTVADAIPPDDPMAAKYRKLYTDMAALAARAPYTIVVDHHPLLGFAAVVSKTTEQPELMPGNLGLQSAFGALNPWLFPPTVQMLLSGHVHLWQQVSFSSPHPTQFVAGFSGTQEDVVPIPPVLPADAAVAPGAAVEAFSSWVDGFGFMTLVRTGAQTWDVEVHDQNGDVVNRCKVTGRHSKCDIVRVSGPK